MADSPAYFEELTDLIDERPDEYVALKDNLVEVGYSLEEIERNVCKGSHIWSFLNYSDSHRDVPDHETVNQAMRGLERIGALKLERKSVVPRYWTDSFTEEDFNEVYSSIELVEQIEIQEPSTGEETDEGRNRNLAEFG